jgi:hypothetical protein
MNILFRFINAIVAFFRFSAKAVKKRVAGGFLVCGRFVIKAFAKPTRFFVNAAAMTRAIMEAVVLVVVIIMLDIYVIGNDAIINSSTTIGAAVVPILQAVLLIVAILGAIGLLYFAAKSSVSK